MRCYAAFGGLLFRGCSSSCVFWLRVDVLSASERGLRPRGTDEGVRPYTGKGPISRTTPREKWGTRLAATYFLWGLKLNQSIMSPIAGLFNGTYGLSLAVTGLGKLSRPRLVTGLNPQFASMNFRIETWSV